MAGPHEIALGIASILGKPGLPNPMTISFRGQSLQSAAEVVTAIISECSDAEIGIDKIELDPDLHRHMVAGRGHSSTVRLQACAELVGEMKIYSKTNIAGPNS